MLFVRQEQHESVAVMCCYRCFFFLRIGLLCPADARRCLNAVVASFEPTKWTLMRYQVVFLITAVASVVVKPLEEREFRNFTAALLSVDAAT